MLVLRKGKIVAMKLEAYFLPNLPIDSLKPKEVENYVILNLKIKTQGKKNILKRHSLQAESSSPRHLVSCLLLHSHHILGKSAFTLGWEESSPSGSDCLPTLVSSFISLKLSIKDNEGRNTQPFFSLIP